MRFEHFSVFSVLSVVQCSGGTDPTREIRSKE